MPTVRPSKHEASCWGGGGPQRSPEQLLAIVTSDDHDDPRRRPTPRLVQSSFASFDKNSPTITVASQNGFVHACIRAYNDHHNLVLRPDDIWVAILTQLGVYINANAEELRSQFVAHEGQQDLHIEVELTPELDHGAMAFEMTKVMASSLKDPGLRQWGLPAFSTTEKSDQAVASVVFMGTMQKYFKYSWGTRCGIPTVTLLGEEDDWIEIAERCASRLGKGSFGPEAARWYQVLQPVLAGFLETFRDPDGPAARRFWQGVVDEHKPNGSGQTAYSGWITAFCYWDEKGECLHKARSGWGHAGGSASGVMLSTSEVPTGFTKVPVTLIHGGNKIPTEMVAGSVGFQVRRLDSKDESAGCDTLQPALGWFMHYV